jgi:GNAT superfamily N-acetyltransferase
MIADLNERYRPGEFAPVDPATFASPVGAVLVAYIDGAAVGCGGLIRVDDEAAELRRMFVHPAHRRQGVARALLGGLELAARRLGYSVLRLETGIRQPEALELYRAAGYADIPLFPPHVDDPLSVCLAKKLERSRPDEVEW